MNATVAKEKSLKNVKKTEAVKNLLEEIEQAITEGKFHLHYANDPHNSKYDDWEYLKSLGYEVKWASHKKHVGYCLTFETELLISWGEGKG